jgi:CBS domain containing-hemolysin-like protein
MTIRDILLKKDNRKLKTIKFKETIKIPLNQPIDNLLETFKMYHKHMAIVMDEYG